MRSSEWSISFLRQLFSLTSRYWRSEEKKSAYAYLLGIVTLTIAAVYMTLLLNDWFNEFYSALQNYDADAVYHGLIRFTGLAFAHIAFAVYAYYLQQQLALRWRRWLTEEYLARWTEREMYYRMDMFSKEADNPDQRISEDINLFTARTLSFMAGLLKAITTIVCFIFVLWQLSEPLPFTVGGETYHIYGYLVWAALIYSLIGTWITHRVGHRLVGLNFVQQKLEADFRYAMVRLRETAESVAFYDGAARERGILSTRFGKLIENTIYIIKKQKQLSWLTNSYGQIAIIFPFVVAAPRYLSKHISLGGLMQVANCFGKVQESMSYFVDVYSSLAEWQSCVDRLISFDAHMAAIREETERAGEAKRREGKELRLSNVEIAVPGGRVLCRHLDAVIHAGEKVIIKGAIRLWEIDAPSCARRFLALCEGRDDPASPKGDHVHPAEALHADGNARRSCFVSGHRAFAEGVGSALGVLRTVPPDPAAGQRRRLEPYPLSGRAAEARFCARFREASPLGLPR